MPAWTFWQPICHLCCIHHYIFHLLPVFIYISAFPLCFRYLIFDHAFVFFRCFFLLELPYMHSWFKLLTPSWCDLDISHKPAVYILPAYGIPAAGKTISSANVFNAWNKTAVSMPFHSKTAACFILLPVCPKCATFLTTTWLLLFYSFYCDEVAWKIWQKLKKECRLHIEHTDCAGDENCDPKIGKSSPSDLLLACPVHRHAVHKMVKVVGLGGGVAPIKINFISLAATKNYFYSGMTWEWMDDIVSWCKTGLQELNSLAKDRRRC